MARTRECRKSQRITRQTRRKVVIRIAPVCSQPAQRLCSEPLAADGGVGGAGGHRSRRRRAAAMEWNELDLVQEFTVEGQCSKIKVRSCRITWDSLQVIPAQRGGA